MGTGTGRLLSNHGLMQVGSLVLGSGATLALNAASANRANNQSTQDYAAVNADTAELNGRLEFNFRYVPASANAALN